MRAVPVQSCRRFCPDVFTKSALSPHLWLCLHCLQVLQLLHIHLSIRRVARPVGSGQGEAGNPADRNSLPKGRLRPQQPLAGSPAGNQSIRRDRECVGVHGCSPDARRCSGQGLWSCPSNEQQQPRQWRLASCLPQQQVRLLQDQQGGPSSLSQVKELRRAPKK